MLTVKEILGRKPQHSMWGLFICDCGKEKKIMFQSIFSGATFSCGCNQSTIIGDSARTHGYSQHPMFKTWQGMIARCYVSTNIKYHLYGGRGIRVCDEWRYSPVEFIEWGIANGWVKGLRVDRENGNGHYEPSNCRITTVTQNNRNKRDNLLLTFNGVTKCASEWALEYGYSRTLIHGRVSRGWSVEKAITTPQLRFPKRKS
jgi:hypothetical protein